MGQWLRRGELARVLGTTVPTVKFYTAEGLFPVAQKTAHGQFLYNPGHIKQIYSIILDLKSKRLTIGEIKDRLQIDSLIRN